MSTRYMKKVYGSDVIPQDNNESASDAEILAGDSTDKSKPFNVFDVVRDNKIIVSQLHIA